MGASFAEGRTPGEVPSAAMLGEPFSFFVTLNTDNGARSDETSSVWGDLPMNKQGEVWAVAKATDGRIRRAEISWRELISEPDLLAVLVFSFIGVLITTNVMFRFPGFGVVIAQYSQF